MVLYGDETSISLVARIQGGDKAAWDHFVWLYGPLIYYWCRQRGVPESELDDVLQEVWIALAPTLGSYHRRPGKTFRGWLNAVTRHKVQEWYRRQSQQLAEAEGGSVAIQSLQQIEAELDASDSTDPGEAAEISMLYRRALEIMRTEFEDRTWKAFVGVVIEGRSARDVGEELGMSLAAIRTAKSRIIKRLKIELGDAID